MIDIRETCIHLNTLMDVLHLKLGISHQVKIINVGSVPCDATADTVDDAVTKTLNNLSNIVDVLAERNK